MKILFRLRRFGIVASLALIWCLIGFSPDLEAGDVPMQKPVSIVSFIDENGTEWYSASEATFGQEHAVNFVLFGIKSATVDELLMNLRLKHPNCFVMFGSVRFLDYPGHSFRELSLPESQEIRVKCRILGMNKAGRS